MLMCPWWFWKRDLALMVRKHVYYQHVKYLRKSNKSALGGLANPKGIKYGKKYRPSDSNITAGSRERMKLPRLSYFFLLYCVVHVW